MPSKRTIYALELVEWEIDVEDCDDATPTVRPVQRPIQRRMRSMYTGSSLTQAQASAGYDAAYNAIEDAAGAE